MKTILSNKWALLALLSLGLVLAWVFSTNDGTDTGGDDQPAVFVAERGDLTVSVLEGGEVFALDAHEVINEVSGSSSVTESTKIVSIVEEGYLVTKEDIKNGKTLVELDTTKLEEKITDQDIDYENSLILYEDALENLSIVASENESKIIASRQDARFSLLDLYKFFGEDAAVALLTSIKLPHDVDSMRLYEEGQANEAPIPRGELNDMVEDALIPQKADEIDFSAYLVSGKLGDGEAQQMLRKLEDTLLLSRTQLSIHQETANASQRLADEGFVTKTALENDLVALEKSRLSVDTNSTELELYRDYEFPKEAELLVATYTESLVELGRDKKEARSLMSKSESKLRSAERKLELEEKKTNELKRQLATCVIKAEVEGLLSYGSARKQNIYTTRYHEPIGEGAGVRFRQPLITIPDMGKPAARINIHESQINHVHIGQRARITFEAEPDKVLEGEVAELAVVPDSNQSRYNPDLKVYPAEIHIKGFHPWLKQGMSAQVEIIANELNDVVKIPLQAVFAEEESHFCYVRNEDGDTERREVSVGEFNDTFVQVNEGITEGDQVYLSRPGSEPSGGDTGLTPEIPPVVEPEKVAAR